MYRKKMLLLLSLVVVVLTITACSTRFIRGSGNLVTEARQVSNFDSIALSGSGEVIVTQDGSESLSVETDDNVMKYVKTEVKGGTLTLGFEDGVNIISTSRLTFYVGVEDLTGLTISGSGDFESDRLETSRLDISVSGSGDVQIAELIASDVKARISGSGEIDFSGNVATQDVAVSGSGRYLAGDVCSEIVTVSVSGSGGATVCANEMLDVDISGSGSVNYYGEPSINASTSGSGSLNKLGK